VVCYEDYHQRRGGALASVSPQCDPTVSRLGQVAAFRVANGGHARPGGIGQARQWAVERVVPICPSRGDVLPAVSATTSDLGLTGLSSSGKHLEDG
jgi:hypothetical protein